MWQKQPESTFSEPWRLFKDLQNLESHFKEKMTKSQLEQALWHFHLLHLIPLPLPYCPWNYQLVIMVKASSLAITAGDRTVACLVFSWTLHSQYFFLFYLALSFLVSRDFPQKCLYKIIRVNCQISQMPKAMEINWLSNRLTKKLKDKNWRMRYP